MKQTEKTLQQIAVAAALMRQCAVSEYSDDRLVKTTDNHVELVPALFRIKEIQSYDDEHDIPLQIKCPVTKEILRARGDRDATPCLRDSKACLAEWEDLELDCATMKAPELEPAWLDYMANHHQSEDYELMIKRFVILNYDLFVGCDLLLVITTDTATCEEITSYALLDRNTSRRPKGASLTLELFKIASFELKHFPAYVAANLEQAHKMCEMLGTEETIWSQEQIATLGRRAAKGEFNMHTVCNRTTISFKA